MNKQLTKVGLQAVQRHPREALRISLLASKHPKTVAKMIKTTRRASRLTATVKLAASNPKVSTEAGWRFQASPAPPCEHAAWE